MYDELVKRLREQVKCNKKLYPQGALFETLLLDLAADAIEELMRRCEQFQYMPPPAWIPVTERLPEEWKPVLCYYEYFRYGEYNCMFRAIDRGYYGDGVWGGEAGQGHKNKVLAWMPLPQPPKEGET